MLTMFERLSIRYGRIDAFVARADRRDEVREPVRRATRGGEVEAERPYMPRLGRQPSRESG